MRTAATEGAVTITFKSVWLGELRTLEEPNGDLLRAVMGRIKMAGLTNLPRTPAERMAVVKRMRRYKKAARGDYKVAYHFVNCCIESILFGAKPHEVGEVLSMIRNRAKK